MFNMNEIYVKNFMKCVDVCMKLLLMCWKLNYDEVIEFYEDVVCVYWVLNNFKMVCEVEEKSVDVNVWFDNYWYVGKVLERVMELLMKCEFLDGGAVL